MTFGGQHSSAHNTLGQPASTTPSLNVFITETGLTIKPLPSLCSRAWEPQLLKPEYPRARPLQLASSPCSLQLEKSHRAAKTQYSQINK